MYRCRFQMRENREEAASASPPTTPTDLCDSSAQTDEARTVGRYSRDKLVLKFSSFTHQIEYIRVEKLFVYNTCPLTLALCIFIHQEDGEVFSQKTLHSALEHQLGVLKQRAG